MIPKDILKKIKRIQITTKRLVTNVFAGEYRSVFKGRGLEFHKVREYQVGDEIRMIDWNVTARMGKPFIKSYVEERELCVMLLLDASGSGHFGTVNSLKKNIAAEICSILAGSAIKNNDRVGLIIFTDKIEKFIPPRKGASHILRVIREALYFKPENRGTDISLCLEYLNKVTTRSTTAFMISDFYASSIKKALSIANKRHDLVAVNITDPRESDMPDVGIIKFEEAETGKRYMVDTADAAVREKYNSMAAQKIKERKKMFNLLRIDRVDVSTAAPYTEALIAFFKKRKTRRYH
ncbi:MAG: DUF58 domain-containing protein [Candidatus Omnitrophica bacterium]|nr:DUF58 domain-containing protein [Candidatus Omnitrophota bacterium]